MRSRIKSHRNLEILVIEPSGTVRNMMTDGLRSLGFTNLHPGSSGRDALNHLEHAKTDWLLMPLMMDQPVNALQILDMIASHPRLKNIETSLFIDPSLEDWCIPAAFTLGLLTFHPRCYAKDAFEREISGLLATIDKHDASKHLIAAQYLRTELIKQKKHTSLLALEEDLLKIYPDSPDLLVSLSEAQFLNKKNPEALISLRQAQSLCPSMQPRCDDLLAKFNASLQDDQASPLKMGGIGLNSVTLVDPDTNILRVLKDLLVEIGVQKVTAVEDGAAAWKSIQEEGCPQLIIQEWRLPTLTGPLFVQRVRDAGHAKVPVLIVSSLVRREEMPLVREMGVDEVLPKPFDRDTFLKTLINILRQLRQPTEFKSLERKIRRHLTAGEHQEAKTWLGKLNEDPHVPATLKSQMEAELLFFEKKYGDAVHVAIATLKAGGESLLLFNLLGKCLLMLQQFESAMKAFEKAHEICPYNIERLLDMAHCQTQLEQLNEAAETIETAKDLDPDNEKVAAAEASNQLERGKIKRAREIFSKIDSSDRIISHMNNRAVALARTGKVESGISIYQSALKAVPDDWCQARMAITYNMALAYARQSNLEKALETAEAVDAKDPKVGSKALSLAKRLRRAIASGGVFDLRLLENSGSTSGILPDDMTTPQPEHSGVRTGLYLVFKDIDGSEKRVERLLEKKLQFRQRDGSQNDAH